eukprot:Trichotokara_eunicae@DN4117_c0_g1_i4.p1
MTLRVAGKLRYSFYFRVVLTGAILGKLFLKVSGWSLKTTALPKLVKVELSQPVCVFPDESFLFKLSILYLISLKGLPLNLSVQHGHPVGSTVPVLLSAGVSEATASEAPSFSEAASSSEANFRILRSSNRIQRKASPLPSSKASHVSSMLGALRPSLSSSPIDHRRRAIWTLG